MARALWQSSRMFVLAAGGPFRASPRYLDEHLSGAANRSARGEEGLREGARRQIGQNARGGADDAGDCQDCGDPDGGLTGLGEAKQ